MSLVERIKDLASQKKITIAELERRTGISNGQIRKWDESTPGIDKVQVVADFFQVSIDKLMGRDNYWKAYDKELGEEKIQQMRDNTQQVSDALELFAAHIDDDLTEEEMEEVLRYIEFIKSKHKK